MNILFTLLSYSFIETNVKYYLSMGHGPMSLLTLTINHCMPMEFLTVLRVKYLISFLYEWSAPVWNCLRMKHI